MIFLFNMMSKQMIIQALAIDMCTVLAQVFNIASPCSIKESYMFCCAGNAMLTVGIISPTGLPVEELSYKKTRPTLYTVSYRLKEKGEHQMIIRWGNDDVPGSPVALAAS